VSGKIDCAPDVAAKKMWSWGEEQWKIFNYNIISWAVVHTADDNMRICQQVEFFPSKILLETVGPTPFSFPTP
jgi:hypothetical protein